MILAIVMNLPASENALSLRQIEPRDAPAVSLLIQQLGYSRTVQQILEWIASVDSRQQAAFVACIGDSVTGWIEVSIERRLQAPPFALIGGLVVAEGFRGNGIGCELGRLAENWAWQHGVQRVRVTSRSTRLDAHRFYLRDGFRLVKTSLVFEKDCPN